MAWVNINVKLSVSAHAIPCDGGSVFATVTVIGQTDAAPSAGPAYAVHKYLMKTAPGRNFCKFSCPIDLHACT